jgi:hypothetical protein
VFEAYVDDSTAVTRNSVQNSCFALYDSSDHSGDLIIFNVGSGETELIVDALPEDMDTAYNGVASQLVYYQVDFTGYGSMRFYFNHDSPYYAGDVVVKKDGESTWTWAYLRHGDGIDADCFTKTSNDPSYDRVNAPAPTEEAPNNWEYQVYFGLVDLSDPSNADESSYSYQDLYSFLFDFDMNSFGSGFINGDKRPAGSGSYSYLMVSNEIMNIGYGENPTQYTFPQLNLDENSDIGGYAVYSGDPNTDTSFRNSPGNLADESFISGLHEINLGGQGENSIVSTPGSAFIVYHEDDYHASEDDLTQIVYLDQRLDYVGENLDGIPGNDTLLTRKELREQYGWYSWDSGLYSTIYDDGDILYHNTEEYGIILNPLYFSLGRMHVYADNPPQQPENAPVYSDSWFDRVISMNIQLQLDAGLRYAEDGLNSDWGSGGTAVGSDDFEKRFLSFLPDWIETPPSTPVARPYDFNGTDDVLELPQSFMIVPQRFKIQHDYVHYCEVYTRSPDCHPEPEEGPFSENFELTLQIGGGDMENRIFFTIDGSEPVVSGDIGDIRILAAGNDSTLLYSEPFPILRGSEPVTVKAVGYQRYTSDENDPSTKERSVTTSAVYVFREPGETLVVTVSNSTLSNGTALFAGLFTETPISLEGELNPLYWGTGTITSGTASLEISDVPDGTYYLCILADTDASESMSDGDDIFPAQTETPRETHQMTGREIVIPDTLNIATGTGSWSEY